MSQATLVPTSDIGLFNTTPTGAASAYLCVDGSHPAAYVDFDPGFPNSATHFTLGYDDFASIPANAVITAIVVHFTYVCVAADTILVNIGLENPGGAATISQGSSDNDLTRDGGAHDLSFALSGGPWTKDDLTALEQGIGVSDSSTGYDSLWVKGESLVVTYTVPSGVHANNRLNLGAGLSL